jgi:hypothetical protein
MAQRSPPRVTCSCPGAATASQLDHRTFVRYATAVGTWHDPDLGRPIAAPLDRCAELLGVDLATIREVAASIEPYIRADGTKVWSLMLLERQLRPEAYRRRRGGYIDRRRTATESDELIMRPQLDH